MSAKTLLNLKIQIRNIEMVMAKQLCEDDYVVYSNQVMRVAEARFIDTDKPGRWVDVFLDKYGPEGDCTRVEVGFIKDVTTFNRLQLVVDASGSK